MKSRISLKCKNFICSAPEISLKRATAQKTTAVFNKKKRTFGLPPRDTEGRTQIAMELQRTQNSYFEYDKAKRTSTLRKKGIILSRYNKALIKRNLNIS